MVHFLLTRGLRKSCDLRQRAQSMENTDDKQQLLISPNDISLVFLLRSHDLISRTLGPVVLTHISKAYPEGWEERVSYFFGRLTRDKLKDTLRKGRLLNDIFVLCKLIRCHLRCVFRVETTEDGKPVEDFQWTEYLNRAVTAVENTRHWTFHGSGSSPEEVATSLFYSERAVGLFAKSNVQGNFSVTLNHLEELRRDYIDITQSGSQTEVVILDAEKTGIFFQRCFLALESNLRCIFEVLLPKEFRAATSERCNLNVLLLFLKRHWDRAEIRSRLVCCLGNREMHSSCNIITELRNSFAHNTAELLLDEQVLSSWKIKLFKSIDLWKALGLDSRLVTDLLGHLENLMAPSTCKTIRHTQCGIISCNP